jgi:phage anti-repressor protein
MTTPPTPSVDNSAADSGAQLIPVFEGQIGEVPMLVCNARELHRFLSVGKDFSTWIKDRINTYGFEEGRDFQLDSPILGNQKGHGGDRRSKDYHLTLDTAKELAMVENNEQGKAARRYFIECERRTLEATPIEKEWKLPSSRPGEKWVVAFDADGKPSIAPYHPPRVLPALTAFDLGRACIGGFDNVHDLASQVEQALGRHPYNLIDIMVTAFRFYADEENLPGVSQFAERLAKYLGEMDQQAIKESGREMMMGSWVREGEPPDEIKVTFVVNSRKDPELAAWLWALPYRGTSAFVRDILSAAARQMRQRDSTAFNDS